VTRLNAAALDYDEPAWRVEQRRAALDVFRTSGLPDPAEEVWRYAPIDKLQIDELELAVPGDRSVIETAIGGRTPAAVLTVQAGVLTSIETSGTADGLLVGSPVAPEGLGELVGADDAFAALNLALTPAPVVIEVAADVTLDGPVVLLVDCPAGISFPRVLVRVGSGARLRLLEHVTGDAADLVASVSEFYVGDGANLEVCTVQTLGRTAWSVLRTRARLHKDAAFSQTLAGLGGHYDRVRADALLEGDGCTSTLHTAHVGTSDQVHDLRTMQDHVGTRTTSRLRSRAAVADSSRSIYSGLVRMRHGARRADSRQVNNSLVLSDEAQADAVPNLDIYENDVRCAHASTVGPVDPEQRWYLESRGVSPADAVQLIIEGFFAEVEDLLDDAVLAAQLRESISRLDASAKIARPSASEPLS
jgi:Fe-S cluster assembly protein SufD